MHRSRIFSRAWPRQAVCFLLLGGAVAVGSCDSPKLQTFLQDSGTSFQVARTFGELISTGPVQIAHYLEVQITPAATPVFVPTTGEIVFDDSFDGLTDCVVIKPKLRDKDKATQLEKLGPGLPEPEELRIALCNLDNSGSPSPLNAAIETLYTDAGASNPADKTTRFFDMTQEEKKRRGDVWAAPEAAFPDPPPAGKKKWSRLGPAAGGKLQIALFRMKDDHPVYLNPAPYLAKIPLNPGPNVVQPPTIAEIKIETATDANFTAGLKSYDVDIATGVLTPNEPLDGFVRVFFRLNDSGTAPVVAPHEISAELRQTGASGAVRSNARFFINSLPTSSAVALTTISQTVGEALYRTVGAAGTVSDPATDTLWLQLLFDPEPHDPASVPSYDVGALNRDDSVEVDAMNGPQPRFPVGDYELEIVVASGFVDAVSDTKVVKFPLAGPVPPATATIVNPIDSDGDTNIDDDATTANNLTGNEFTFSATAPPAPGVLTIPVRVDLVPDDAATRAAFAGRVRTRISAIDDSHGAAANVQMAWTTPFPGDPTAGSAVYNPGTTHWETQVAFTNLPPNNTDFGVKTVTVEVLDSNNTTILQTRTVNIEVFWPLLLVSGGARNDANFAKNHPGANLSAAATHTGNGVAASTRAPNWFFYWRQAVGATAAQTTWDSTDPTIFGNAPAMLQFSRTAPKGPYVNAHQDILINEQAQDTDTTGGTTTGIDAFADTIMHENFHWTGQTIAYTNTAFGLGIGGATNVADVHWSFNVARPAVVPVPPLPAGRVYNHFVDLNANGNFTDPGEDLDVDGDDVHNGSDGPGVGVESLANAAEGNVEHGLAAQDWGNPGKQHATPNVHTD